MTTSGDFSDSDPDKSCPCPWSCLIFFGVFGVFILIICLTDSGPATLPLVECVTKDGIVNTFYNDQVMSNIKLDKLIPVIRAFKVDFKRMLTYVRVAKELSTLCPRREIDDVYNKQFSKNVGAVRENLIASIKRLRATSVVLYSTSTSRWSGSTR